MPKGSPCGRRSRKNGGAGREDAQGKETAPIQAISRTSSKTGIRQERLVEEDELMALNWE